MKRKYSCKDCNFQLYLVNLQRSGLKRILNKSTIIKSGHSIDYLGCEPSYFKRYIESKMIVGIMNWKNIHLDHIKPVNAFNLDVEK
jgi:predicted nuclease of restriction endonuclease-like (RecB) superfamily